MFGAYRQTEKQNIDSFYRFSFARLNGIIEWPTKNASVAFWWEFHFKVHKVLTQLWQICIQLLLRKEYRKSYFKQYKPLVFSINRLVMKCITQNKKSLKTAFLTLFVDMLQLNILTLFKESHQVKSTDCIGSRFGFFKRISKMFSLTFERA